MQYRVEIQKHAQKELEKLTPRDQERVVLALRDLTTLPFSGKKLHGVHSDKYSIRVWPYRVVYKVYKKILVILVLGVTHRKDAY